MEYPRQYGSYTLLERIGQGGMSEVDLARREVREGSYIRFVVIKRVAAKNATDDSFLTMFKDEARINAQLHHQNIAQVYDFGVEGDEFFLVMEYVPGMDLRAVQKALAKRGRMLPPRVSLSILAEVLHGLSFAHTFIDPEGRSLNVVHRDVNPRNVMVGLTGEVKLIDFGVAKADGRLESTQGQSLKGKFAYMAPEQIESQRGVDHRADLFAVGLMFHELMTGVHPFYGLKEVQILHRVLSGQVGQLEPLPEGLDSDRLRAIHAKALSVDPDARYPDALAFRRDLERAAASLGGFCSKQDIAKFLKRVDPDMTESISTRMQTWRSGAVPMPPSTPPQLAQHDQSLTLATQATQKSQVTARTVVAAGVGGGLVAALGLAAVGVLGVGVWYAQSGEPEPEPLPALTETEAAPQPTPSEGPAPSVEPQPQTEVTPPPQTRPEPRPVVQPQPEPVRDPPPEPEEQPEAEPVVVEAEPEAEPEPEPSPPVETAYLAVTSKTKGLEVIIDGRVVARTPNMLITVPVGAQTITIRDPATGASETTTLNISKTQKNLLKSDL